MRLWQILRALGRIRRAWSTSTRGQVCFTEIQRLGGALPKAAQFACLQRDAIPSDVCDALMRFLSECPSIGVVILTADVAEKRVRPEVAAQFAADLQLLRYLAWLLPPVVFVGALLGGRFRLAWRLLLQPSLLRISECQRTLAEQFALELNLEHEGACQKLMRTQLKAHGIDVPAVLSATPDCLRSERIHGHTLDALMRMPAAQCAWWLLTYGFASQRAIAKRGFGSILRQLIEDNRLHADLHAGNIMVSARQRLWVIDFGAVGQFDADFVLEFALYVRALVGRKFQEAARHFCNLCRNLVSHGIWTLLGLDGKRIARLTHRLADVMATWVAVVEAGVAPYAQRSMTALANLLMAVVAECGGALEWGMTKLHRTLSLFDGVIAWGWSGMNCLTAAARYLADAARRAVPVVPSVVAWNNALEVLDAVAQDTRRRGAIGWRNVLFNGA
jgi:tRNA A-37 threonylcarbamoyl transferase component Bud32